MEAPSNIETTCPKCDEETMHNILKGTMGKGKGSTLVLDATVKCSVCGRVHHVHIRRERPIAVQVIISEGKSSERVTIEVPPDTRIDLKDELEVDGTVVQVTSIEKDGKRVDRAKAEDIGTLWTKRFDQITVKVSIFKGRRTSSEILVAAPNEEFGIGDMLEVKGRMAAIESIKIEGRTIRKGMAEAREIVRIYAREIK